VQKDVMVPMRDGVRLSADIYRPSKEGTYPVILLRTMYGKRNPGHKYSFTGSLFASQGYVFIVQDVRGKFDSEASSIPISTRPRTGTTPSSGRASRVEHREGRHLRLLVLGLHAVASGPASKQIP
jgi:cephalosporin-C deacetylase-like acetyl esterase